MPHDADLQQLAAMAGIASRYVDALGQEIEVPAPSLAALLAAMGLPAGSPAEIAASRARLEAADWQDPLPPASVVRESDPSVALVLPETADALRLAVHLEDGGSTELELDPARFPAEAGHSLGGRQVARRRVALEPLPSGYHLLQLGGPAGSSMRLIVAPPAAWLPPEIAAGRRLWGIACQLYALRSERNWGIGDFTDLADLCRQAARLGAAAVGLNPLHALFPAEPERCSPYSPSSRLFLNVLYIDPDAVPDFVEAPEGRRLAADPAFRKRLAALREAPLVDYPGVAALKREALEIAWRWFRMTHAADERGAAFRSFCARHGEALENHARFDALSEHFGKLAGGSPRWRVWPQPYQDPRSREVREFARTEAQRIGFYQYLQWQADEQLRAAAEVCRAGGMAIGLYRDVAVGSDPVGAEAWLEPHRYIRGATIGAPPDIYNRLGQNWGLPPLNPVALRQQHFRPFIELMRANMRHAGAIRIDHVLGLMRVFLIPEGSAAAAGAYVAYPLGELLGIVALESCRARCLVIGEDLGTVPPGLVERLQENHVLSCRLLWFERGPDGAFLSPESYPALALAAVSTHDLPTLRGWWTGHDITVRAALGLSADSAMVAAEQAEREADRRRLLAALRSAGIEAPEHPGAEPPVEAVHHFMARTESRIFMVQIEDIAGELDQANLPGTVHQHPNWRRKLSVGLETLSGHRALVVIAGLLGKERP